MKDVLIGVVQMNCRVGDSGGNIEKINRYLGLAVEEGVEVLCFPETCIQGYTAGTSVNVEAEPLDGELVGALVELGKQHKITFLPGLLERDAGGSVFNTQLVIDEHGLRGAYRKSHVAASEIKSWSAGDQVAVFDHPRIRFGIEICFDSHFPEVSTILAEKGAELLFFPHASAMGETVEEKKERWLRYMPARANDNAVFVAVCNQVGDGGDRHQFSGVSFIFDPYGKILAESSSKTVEELVIAELKSDLISRAQSDPECFYRSHRRPTMYEKWMSETD